MTLSGVMLMIASSEASTMAASNAMAPSGALEKPALMAALSPGGASQRALRNPLPSSWCPTFVHEPPFVHGAQRAVGASLRRSPLPWIRPGEPATRLPAEVPVEQRVSLRLAMVAGERE